MAIVDPYAPHPPHSPQLSTLSPIVAPASTVLFVAKSPPAGGRQGEAIHEAFLAQLPPANIPSDSHYIDLTVPNTIVVTSQPVKQHNAVVGGIMAARMKELGALGVVVSGRIRDLRELRALDLPVRRTFGNLNSLASMMKYYSDLQR
jgi:regulator of RNase E activity RraA